MVDLRERMKEVEQNDSLDLWDEIAARTPSYDEGGGGLRSRVIAGVVAAAVAVAGFAFTTASSSAFVLSCSLSVSNET